jgi:hypothetical protein
VERTQDLLTQPKRRISVSRTERISASVLCAVAVGALAATSAAKAAPSANQICPTFTKSGVKYQGEVIGNVTCTKAKVWISNMLAAHVAGQSYVHEKIPGSPKGFHCYATLVRKHQARDGICYTGTLAYPTNGFTW